MKVGITPYFPTKIDFYYVHQFSCPLINCHCKNKKCVSFSSPKDHSTKEIGS